MNIDDIKSFNKEAAIKKLTDMWEWLGPQAAEAALDAIAGDIHDAIQESQE